MYPIAQIAAVANASFLIEGKPDAIIQYLAFDSRKIILPETTLFFAIKGRVNDGHLYLDQLYNEGVRNFVVQKEVAKTNFPEANVLIVEDSVLALQKIGKFHRHQFDLQVIGITGSNGKTIVKEWLGQLLQSKHKVVSNPKSYNSQIGVPLSLWRIRDYHEVGIFEAGISRKGEMEKLSPLINCSIGIFTNLGEAHSEGFESLEEKGLEKVQLFEHCDAIIYCKDHTVVEDVLIRKYGTSGKKLIRWSMEEVYPLLHNHLPGRDAISIENAGHCVVLLQHLGYSQNEVAQLLQYIRPVELRMEIKPAIHQSTLINDSYSSDLSSLAIALDFLQQQSNSHSRRLILSDILQTGKPQKQLYKEVCQLILSKGISKLIGIGKELSILDQLLPNHIQRTFYTTTDDFLNRFDEQEIQQEAILLKGARAFEFEKIAHRLEAKVHNTVLEINLSALSHNLKVFRKHLQPTTKIMAMVKAAAYGSGSYEVAKLLEFQHIDYLCVAYVDEGVELRKAGIQLPILVLNPDSVGFESIMEFELEPEIYSVEQLLDFTGLFDRFKHRQPSASPLQIHLKVNTGMNRLGFEEHDLPALISTFKDLSNIEIKSIFSHLAASEDEQEDAFSKQQFHQFNLLSDTICDALEINPLRHILNSGGIIRHPDFQLDMVRLGIGLYGVDSSKHLQNELEIVTTLKSRISQIKHLKAGDTVGYGRQGKINTPTTIATISIGYGDGFSRRLGNGVGSVILHGQVAAVIGNVCMDMTMIDISHIEGAKVGDEVIIFGADRPVQELASLLGTIPYEVFTSISARVKRIYFQE